MPPMREGSPHVMARNGQWTSRDPGTPQNYQSRSITFGIWRGFDHVFTYHIPKSAFKTGTNTLEISNLSGTRGYGGFLSHAFVFDYIALRK